MDIVKMENMKDGWFIGNFEPSAFKTEQFEVCYREHKAGEYWNTHFHKIGTEINFLVSGKMIIGKTELNKGDIFILHPLEVADPIFIEDCIVLIIKTPSIPGDKYVI
jgi:hypothetical protein